MSTPAFMLPQPQLTRVAEPFSHLTDLGLAESRGVSVVFTGRAGGVSRAPFDAPFDSLNLSGQVGDDPATVAENRSRLKSAFGISSWPLVIPHQVHGDHFICFGNADEDCDPASVAPESIDADAVVVASGNTAAMLCFADCVPVVAVTPTGRFAVIHAGWRGVMNHIAPKVVDYLAQTEDPSTFNLYIGPHIGPCDFECGEETYQAFIEVFGPSCDAGANHIDLAAALREDLREKDVRDERICDCGICTVCQSGEYFSYRAASGVCGRQAALAFRRCDRVNEDDQGRKQ